MDTEQIILQGGRVFYKGNLIDADVLIENGKIRKVAFDITEKGDEVNCKGLVILPGMIDAHVHFREPGFTQKEDFFTGGCAAVAGGVTTILDMPNTNPFTVTVADLEKKRELAKKSVCNYGFHFGCTKDNIEEIKKAKNVASTKIYMDKTTGNMKLGGEEVLGKIFSVSRQVSVHAEGENVGVAIDLAKKTNKKLYLAHISECDEIEYIKKKRTENIFVEVSPHHLYFQSTNDNLFDVKPSLKTKKDSECLWSAIKDGIVDTIGSDHAPHTIGEKKKGAYGLPGVQTTLPLMLDAVNKGRITLQRLVELFSYNPAKIFGIKNRGEIKEGLAADLVVVDMNKEKKVLNEEMLSKCGWSPYKDKLLKGWPVVTIVNGCKVYADNKVLGDSKGKEVEFE